MSRSTAILINTSNLHIGGGVQVATSFLYELSLLTNLNFTPTVYLSMEVNEELKKLGVDTNQKNWMIYNTYGLKDFFKNKKLFSQFNIVFTIFGPNYFVNEHQKCITGFAQAWIIYPNNEIFKKLSIANKLKTRLKFFIQKAFFKLSNQLVVELDHVKEQLVDLKIKNNNDISIVRNCFSSIYLDPSKWQSFTVPSSASKIKLGIVTRDYPHKNISILPDVKKILLDQYNIDADIYVTLNDNEWAARNQIFKESIINVGALSMSQCPTFYQSLDGLIFPSLLECSIFLFIGFGYKIGLDWPEYSRIFTSNPENTTNYEVGYLLLIKLLSPVSNFWFFVITIKLMYVLSIILMAAKYSKNPTFTLTLMIGFLFAFMNDPLRQIIAIIIFYSFFIVRKKEGGVLSIGVMSIFHTSSIILLSTKIQHFLKKKHVLFYIALTITITISLKSPVILSLLKNITPDFLFYKINLYVTHAKPGNIAATLFRILFFAYIVLSNKVKINNIHCLSYKTYKLFWFFSLISLLLEILALQLPLLAQRMRLYLVIFPIILFSNQLFCNRKLMYIFISITLLIFLLLSLYLFSKGEVGNFYTLEKNIFIQYLLDFPNESWEKNVWDYWNSSR